METGIVGSVLPSVLRRRKNEDGIVPDKSMQEDCATALKTAQTLHGRPPNANSEPSEADETTKCSGNDTDDATMNGSQNPGEGDEAIDEKVNRIVQKILETSSTDKSKKPKQANGVRKAERPSQGAPRKRPPKNTDEKAKAGTGTGTKGSKATTENEAPNGTLEGELAKQDGNAKKEKSAAPKKKKTENDGTGTGTGSASGAARSKSRKRTNAASQKKKNASLALFPRTAMLTRNWTSTNRFEVDMCLESIDPQRPSAFCPFVVVEKKTFRIRLHFIDYSCEYFDFWIPFYSPLLFPVGFCERTGRTLRSRTAPTGADERTTSGTPAAFSWRAYFEKHTPHRAAPPTCFATLGREQLELDSAATPDDSRFRVGMKLEALDKRNPNMYGVATVRDVLELEINELVPAITNVASTLDHVTQPNGTCATLDESSTAETRAETLPCAASDQPEPAALDSAENSTTNRQPNGESAAPESSKSNGPPASNGSGRGRPLTYLLVHFDGWPEEYEHWCDAASVSVRWCSFCAERGELLCLPSEWPQHVTFDWPQYLAHTHAVAAPRRAFHSAADAEMDLIGFNNTQPVHFDIGMRLCAVDRRNPQVVRYASVRAVESHKLLLRFEDFDEPPSTTVCRLHPRDAMDMEADADYPAECVCASEEDEAEREERAARFDFWLDEDSLDMLPVEFAQRIGAYIMKPMSAEERATQRRLAQLKSGDTSSLPADTETSTAEPDEDRAKQRKPWVYRCLTPGCRGRGHLNGYTVKHMTEVGCPYSGLNASKTMPLYDRYEFDRALEKHAADNGQTVEQMAGTSAINEFIERYFARAAAEEPPPPPPSGFVPFAFRQLSQSSDRSAAGRTGAGAKGNANANAKAAQKPLPNSRASTFVKGATPSTGKPVPTSTATCTSTSVTPAATSVPTPVNGLTPAIKTALSRKRAQGDSDSEASRSVSRSRSASPGAPPPVSGDSGQFKTPLPPKRNRLSADAKPPEPNDILRAIPVDAATLRNLARDEAGIGMLLNAVGVDTSLLAVGARARSSEMEPEVSRWLTPVSAEMWRQQVLKLTAVDLRELRSHLETSVLLWNREQLVIFVVQVTNQRDSASAIRRAFDEHSIDPASFLLLHFSDLTRSMHLRVGIALKIFACVQYLRGEIAQLPGDTPLVR